MMDINSNEVMLLYNPSQDVCAWQFLNMSSIPIAQRSHIDFVLGDLFEKIEVIESGSFSTTDLINLVWGL